VVLRSGLARLAACLVLTTIVAAACSSDNNSSASTPQTAAPTTTGASTSAPATTAADPSETTAPADTTASSDTTASTDAAAPEGVAGGSLTYITGTEVPGMDPIDGGTSVAVTTNTYDLLLYDQLVRVDLDGTIDPRLAESVTGSADSGTWTITLRDGLQFSDGTPLDAAAVIFNWDRFANPDTGGRCVGDAAAMRSYKAIDDTTIEAVLKEPNSQFPRLLMNCLGTLGSPTGIQAAGQEGFTTAPVGAGPFVLQEWVRNDHATFVRNPNFWDAPRPYLDSITVRPVPDQQQRFDAFRTADGPAAILANVPDQHMSELAADGYEVKHGKPYGGVSLGFNMSRPPFDDVRVRQAFSYALNLDDINAKAAQGFAEMSTNIFPEGSPFADPSGDTKTNDLAKAQSLIDDYVAGGERSTSTSQSLRASRATAMRSPSRSAG
jgi:peptide/nickel transport system substrate-binding protein